MTIACPSVHMPHTHIHAKPLIDSSQPARWQFASEMVCGQSHDMYLPTNVWLLTTAGKEQMMTSTATPATMHMSSRPLPILQGTVTSVCWRPEALRAGTSYVTLSSGIGAQSRDDFRYQNTNSRCALLVTSAGRQVRQHLLHRAHSA
jgi:hypothetical protein